MIAQDKLVSNVLIASTGTTNTVTASLDTRGYGHATIIVSISAELTTDAEAIVLDLLHSDDTVVTNHTTLQATVSVTSVGALTQYRYNVDLRGKKRYLRLTCNPDGTVATDDAYSVHAVALLGRADAAPTNAAAAVAEGSAVNL